MLYVVERNPNIPIDTCILKYTQVREPSCWYKNTPSSNNNSVINPCTPCTSNPKQLLFYSSAVLWHYHQLYKHPQHEAITHNTPLINRNQKNSTQTHMNQPQRYTGIQSTFTHILNRNGKRLTYIFPVSQLRMYHLLIPYINGQNQYKTRLSLPSKPVRFL